MSTTRRSPTLRLSVFLLALLLFTQTVAAQFEGMFNNMFGQQQQRGHHHHHGQEQGSGHGVRGWDLQDAGESLLLRSSLLDRHSEIDRYRSHALITDLVVELNSVLLERTRLLRNRQLCRLS